MPVAIAGALVSAGLGTAMGGALTLFGTQLGVMASFMVRFAVSFVLAEVSGALTSKGKSSKVADQAQQRTQQITQAVSSSEKVYGVSLKSGTVVYASNTEDNKYTHLVIVVADHEVAGLDEVAVGDDILPNDYFDDDGNVIRGKYCSVASDGTVTSYLRVRKFLGTSGQTADEMLIAENSELDSNFRLQGRAGIYVRYERNQSVFSGAPNFAVIVRGARVYDPRLDITAWSPNVGLMAYDWMRDNRLGVGIPASNIDLAETEAGANASDEMVETQNLSFDVTRIDLSATVSTVSAGDDSLTTANENFMYVRGTPVQVTSDGTMPGGLVAATTYYIIPGQRTDAKFKVKLAATPEDADDGTAINITSAGSGNIKLVKPTETILTLGNETYAQLLHGDAVQVSSSSGMPGGLQAGVDYYVIPYQYSGTVRLKLAASLADALANDGVGIPVPMTSEGSGAITLTKTHEPRYYGGGVMSSDRAVGDCLKDVLTGMAGCLSNSGGIFAAYAGVWRGPTATLTPDDMRSALSIQTKVSWSSRFNSVIGTYISPANNWQAADYPQVKNSNYRAADLDNDLQGKLDLPITQRASAAQRIAKIKLDLSRQEIVATCPAKLTALQHRPKDTLYMDFPRYGWDAKIFEVQSWKMSFTDSGENAVPGVDMVLQETASECFDWNNGQEILVDPAPNSNLPSATKVGQVEGLGISSIAIATKGGDTIYRAIASWDEITNGYVRRSGKIHFQYRITGTTTWIRLPAIPGDASTADIYTGALGTEYDLQVWMENSFGLIGNPYQLSGLVLGYSGGVGATIDWGSVADAVGTTNDWGSVADAVGATNDWGGLA